MNNKQVRKYFVDKEDAPCPLTDELTAAGYRQKSGGYLDYARDCDIENPSQYWHLIHSWSANSTPDQCFGRNIVCGELIFWMAEVSQALDRNSLVALKDQIIGNCLEDRTTGNRIIQDVCFDKIVEIVEQLDEEH